MLPLPLTGSSVASVSTALHLHASFRFHRRSDRHDTTHQSTEVSIFNFISIAIVGCSINNAATCGGTDVDADIAGVSWCSRDGEREEDEW